MSLFFQKLCDNGVAKIQKSRALTPEERAYLDSPDNLITEKLAKVEQMLDAQVAAETKAAAETQKREELKASTASVLNRIAAMKPAPPAEPTRATFMARLNAIEDPQERGEFWAKWKHLIGYK